MALPRSFLVFVSVLSTACAARRSAPSVPPAAGETISIHVAEGTFLGFDLSRDGRWMVLDLLGQLWRIPAEGGPAVPLTDAVRDTAQDLEPAIAPDGRRIAFRGERRGRQGLWLLDTDRGAPRQLTQLPDPDGFDGNAAWSPDGETIAFTRLLPPDSGTPPRTAIAIVDPAGGAVRILRLTPSVGPNVADPAWHPQGEKLALVARASLRARAGRIWMVDTALGTAAALTDSGIQARMPAFAPGGDRLAYVAPDSSGRLQVWVRDLGSDPVSPRRITDHRDVTPTRIAWTPDGARVVYGADGKLWTVPHRGGSPVQVPFSAELSMHRAAGRPPAARFPEAGVREPARAFMGLALSPDGQRISMIALGALWEMSVGGAPRRLGDVPFTARYLTWSPDGTEVAWSAGPLEAEDVFVTHLATARTRRLTALHGREVFPGWSPDGRWISFVHAGQGQEPQIRLVAANAAEVADTAHARTLGEIGLEWTGTAAFAPVWSPDGSRLLAPAPNYDARRPARAALIGLSGTRTNVALAQSPIFVQWTTDALVYVRHARLWRVGFDSTGAHGAPVPLGSNPAAFPSISRAGHILYISEGGLRLRLPDGRERRLGWPLEFTPPIPPPLLVRNARVIDGTGTPASAPQDVFVERGRITRMEPAGRLAPAAQVLDARGAFLIPGLMDLHAHQYQPELLPGFLYFGVTTVRDQGSPISALVASANAIAAGLLPGPRVSYGGFQFYSDWHFDAEDGHGIEPEADPDHVRRAVALAETFGAQHVKVRTFRRWDIHARIVAEAHRLGMRVTGHCAHPLALVVAGFDTKEHALFCNARDDAPIYDDLVQLYRAAGISVVPTVLYSSLAARLDRPDYFADDEELASFTPPISSDDWMLKLNAEGRRYEARVADMARAATARMVRAGVTIGAGTDVWQIPSGVHLELEELVKSGLTPLEAIRAATGDAARILGAERDLGTIVVGKRADFVILDADPGPDIRNTRRIRAVIQDGRVIDRQALRTRYGRPPRDRGGAAP